MLLICLPLLVLVLLASCEKSFCLNGIPFCQNCQARVEENHLSSFLMSVVITPAETWCSVHNLATTCCHLPYPIRYNKVNGEMVHFERLPVGVGSCEVAHCCTHATMSMSTGRNWILPWVYVAVCGFLIPSFWQLSSFLLPSIAESFCIMNWTKRGRPCWLLQAQITYCWLLFPVRQ